MLNPYKYYRRERSKADRNWGASILRRPLRRYKTHASPEDVITLIQMMERIGGLSDPQVLVFAKEMPPQQRKGIRYTFCIEYYWHAKSPIGSSKGKAKSSKSRNEPIDALVGQRIDGQVISQDNTTIIEFRSTLTEYSCQFFLKLAVGWCVVALLIGLVDFSLTFLLVMIGLIIILVSPFFYFIHRLEQTQGMKPILKTLGAVHIDDELPKLKNDEKSKAKHGI